VKPDIGINGFKAFIEKLYAVYNASLKNAREQKIIFKKQRIIQSGKNTEIYK
jgi:hypothetical protein